MAGSMSQLDLIADLKGMLGDAVKAFNENANGDYIRHLTIAALDLGRVRPRTLLGQITLQADQGAYDLPAGYLDFKYSLWGHQERAKFQPWDPRFPIRLPKAQSVETDSGKQLILTPAPTAEDIVALGSTYKFFYYAGHQVGAEAAQTSVNAGDRHLLLMRALAAALLEIAANSIYKPVQLGPGIGQMPKNGSPAYLAEQALKQFETMAA